MADDIRDAYEAAGRPISAPPINPGTPEFRRTTGKIIIDTKPEKSTRLEPRIEVHESLARWQEYYTCPTSLSDYMARKEVYDQLNEQHRTFTPFSSWNKTIWGRNQFINIFFDERFCNIQKKGVALIQQDFPLTPSPIHVAPERRSVSPIGTPTVGRKKEEAREHHGYTNNSILVLAQDASGSRNLQGLIERSDTLKPLILHLLRKHVNTLIVDVYGNYVIQKVFEHADDEVKLAYVKEILPYVPEYCMQTYACRALQKAFEHGTPQVHEILVLRLQGHYIACIKDQNGNHVIQKMIECVKPQYLSSVVTSLSGSVVEVCVHPYGCRVMQRFMENCPRSMIGALLDELHGYVLELIKDQYGNYVIQHVIENGDGIDRAVIYSSVLGSVSVLSRHKFASNVVERCVKFATDAELSLMLKEVLYSEGESLSLHVMANDQYANYVVQQMLNRCSAEMRRTLVEKLNAVRSQLKKVHFGKFIVTKLDYLDGK